MLATPQTDISMFDWPEQSHTSPTNTSLTVTEFVLPFARSWSGPPACKASNRTDHFPSAAAVAVLVWPPSATVTASPGSAHPQTGSVMSRCKTMWSPNTPASFTSADATAVRPVRMRIVAMTCRSMLLGIIGTPCR